VPKQVFAARCGDTSFGKVLPYGPVLWLVDVGAEEAPKTVAQLPVEIDKEGTIRRAKLDFVTPLDVPPILGMAQIRHDLRRGRHWYGLKAPTLHQTRPFHELILADQQI
jgi:hypothetical protein